MHLWFSTIFGPFQNEIDCSICYAFLGFRICYVFVTSTCIFAWATKTEFLTTFSYNQINKQNQVYKWWTLFNLLLVYFQDLSADLFEWRTDLHQRITERQIGGCRGFSCCICQPGLAGKTNYNSRAVSLRKLFMCIFWLRYICTV